MATRRENTYSKETKAAVLAALLAGQGVGEVAKEYKIPKQTVSRWQSELSPDQLGQIGTKRAEVIEELLATYLRETLTTLIAQSRFFRNEKWLTTQPASDLAVLHGVQTDKAIRLLEAIERANESA